MSWLLGDDDPAQFTGLDDDTRREAWSGALQLLAVLAIYGFMALTLGDTLKREDDAEQRRLAPAIEAMRACLGKAAPELDVQVAMRRCAEQRATPGGLAPR